MTQNPTNTNLARWLVLLILLLTFPFLFIGGPGPTSLPVYRAVWNLGHLLFFGLLVFFLIQFPERGPRLGIWSRTAGISALVLFLGIAVEWAQYGVNRDPDWHDIWRNMLGAWLAWFFLSRRIPGRRLILGILGLAVALEVGLVANVAWQDRMIQRQLPIIAELEEEPEREYWSGEISMSDEVAAFGRKSLKVSLKTDTYSGTGTKTMPRDWRGFENLKFEVFNPEPDTLKFTLRIHDKGHNDQYNDRFNTRLETKPGWNSFSIALEEVQKAPQGRNMKMSQIHMMVLFATRLNQPRIIYLDYFRLE